MNKLKGIILIIFYLGSLNIMGQHDSIVSYSNLWSKYVDPRNVDILLPSTYHTETGKKYPVIYMHDGQNLFTGDYSYGGEEWGVDETVNKLTAEGTIPECIIIGIWNTPKRYPEYQPQKPFYDLEPGYRKKVMEYNGGEPVSDNYLRFIVSELKPFIDDQYRTLPEQENTFIIGSSMGGLISIYALCEYPEVFGGAACLSTHWVSRADLENDEMGRVMAAYLSENLPVPGDHKIYFDFGTENLDSYYQKHQKKIDAVMLDKGFTMNKDWVTRIFKGADHNEKWWRKRLDVPLKFLLGSKN